MAAFDYNTPLSREYAMRWILALGVLCLTGCGRLATAPELVCGWAQDSVYMRSHVEGVPSYWQHFKNWRCYGG